jgi:hypothetical protein
MSIELDKKGLASYLYKNMDLDFVAAALTPWHAHNIDAAIARLRKENNHLKGIVLIERHNKIAYYLEEASFICKQYENIRIVYYFEESNSSILDYLERCIQIFWYSCRVQRNKDKVMYVIAPAFPQYWLLIMLKKMFAFGMAQSIIVDEGLGIYMRTRRDWILAEQTTMLSTKSIMMLIRQFVVLDFSKKLLQHKSSIDNWSLFYDNRHKQLKPNLTTIYYLADVLDQYAQKCKVDLTISYQDKILFLTQPFVEDQDINCNDNKAILNEVTTLLKNSGSVVHKPHPREHHLSDYLYPNVDTDMKNNKLSLECLLNTALGVPRVIVGYSSTALISAKLLYKIETISLIDLVDKHVISKKLAHDFHKFKKMFSPFVHIPKTHQELAQLLDGI